jgi:hypothetical protein
VLTGTPMENRLDELASIVEWVDDFAREPKWRLASWHTTPSDSRTEVAGARNLATLRTRLAPTIVRRVRHDVLSQLPARTDTRIPIEMTAEQLDEHDALNLPIAQLLGRAQRRPLTQAEFLRLMSLLTTQRVIANEMAQLRFARDSVDTGGAVLRHGAIAAGRGSTGDLAGRFGVRRSTSKGRLPPTGGVGGHDDSDASEGSQ